MKEDLKEIENKIMEFCKKYNCSIETHTLSDGRDRNGNIHILKVCSKITTQEYKMYCKYLSKSLKGNLRCKLLKTITYIDKRKKCLKNDCRKNERYK